MTTPSNAMPESSLDVQAIAPAATSATQPFLWSVRRELWENRSIYIAPLAAAGVAMLGFFIGLFWLPHSVHARAGMDPGEQFLMEVMPYGHTGWLLLMTAFLVGVFYSLDALYGERRDRSILFWKSLPVSDLTTVLAKASIPLLALPVISFAVTLIVETIMLLLSSAVVAGSGFSVADFWNRLELYPTLWGLAYHLVTVHMLWYAPLYCWLFLVSAWSRRTPFLWAALPPFAVVIFEKIAFHTSYFLSFLNYRFSGGQEATGTASPNMLDPDMHMTPGPFLITPGLWLGLVFAAVFLLAAARLRRKRSPL